MTPSAYVSCPSHELPRAVAAMTALRALGVTVVGDWTEDVARYGNQSLCLDWRERARISDGWRSAIRSAHVVLVLLPLDGKSEGVAYELGVAHTLGRVVVTSHPAPRKTLALVGMSLDALTRGHWIHYSGDEAAVSYAARVARAEAR